MGRLKIVHKIKASSLVEAITSTVLLMIVFTLAIMSISNVLERTVKNNTSDIDKELLRLEYLYRNGKVQVPDTYGFKSWNIDLSKEKENELSFVVLKAISKNSSKKKTRRILEK